MTKGDEQLIADYLEGNERALDALVDRYLADVYNFSFTLVRDEAVAEDVVQESFVKAWKSIRRFSPGNSFKGWLFSIVRNTAIDWLRKKKEFVFSNFENAKGENPFIDNIPDDMPNADELLGLAEDKERLEEILAELNPQYREVLALRRDSNMTFEEIGKALKRPMHTVKSQYRRGMAALKRLLDAKTI